MGGIIGGIGSLIGGAASASAERDAAQMALTGYNYLKSNPLIQNLQTSGQGNIANENTAVGNQAGTVEDINKLLTSPDQNNPAFKNYLNSTGYNFQLQQGEGAITGNAAAKGLLNSGATAKALTSYGENLASTTFNNYLSQLGGLANQQGANATSYMALVNQGLNAAEDVGAAGATGGASAANALTQAGQSTGTSIAQAFNNLGGYVQNGMNTGNWFGTPATAPSSVF